MISQYIKDKKGNKRGLLVAAENQHTGYVTIGWSLCNKKDKFSKNRARAIATGRAARNRYPVDFDDAHNLASLPDIVKEEIETFIYRVSSYFKKDVRNDIKVA